MEIESSVGLLSGANRGLGRELGRLCNPSLAGHGQLKEETLRTRNHGPFGRKTILKTRTAHDRRS
jgi:hypothetical protein